MFLKKIFHLFFVSLLGVFFLNRALLAGDGKLFTSETGRASLSHGGGLFAAFVNDGEREKRALLNKLKHGSERERIDILKFHSDELYELWDKVFSILMTFYRSDPSEEIRLLSGQFLNWHISFTTPESRRRKLLTVNKEVVFNDSSPEVKLCALRGFRRIGSGLYGDKKFIKIGAPFYLKIITDPKMPFAVRKEGLSSLMDLSSYNPPRWLLVLPYYRELLMSWYRLPDKLLKEAVWNILSEGVGIREKGRIAELFFSVLNKKPAGNKQQFLKSVYIWLGYSFSVNPQIKGSRDLVAYYQLTVSKKEYLFNVLKNKIFPDILKSMKSENDKKQVLSAVKSCPLK